MGCLYCYLKLLRKVPMVSWNIHTIIPYVENVQTVSRIKGQLMQHKAQNYIILYFVHTPYSLILQNKLSGVRGDRKYRGLHFCLSWSKWLKLTKKIHMYCQIIKTFKSKIKRRFSLSL